MIELNYILGFIGAATAVVSVLVIGTFASAGLIFTGDHHRPHHRPHFHPHARPHSRA